MLRVLVVALVLLVAALFLLPRPQLRAPENATLIADAAPLPSFTLEDTAGKPLTNAGLEGGFSLLFFGYTNCPDVCPLTLQVLASAMQNLRTNDPKLAPEALPRVVFVSVDPARDSPERVRKYLDAFDKSFVGATGSDGALAPLLKTLGVTVMRMEQHGEQYTMVHNGTVYFIGPKAELIAVSSPPLDPETLAHDYIKIRALYARGR
ncbi:MAG TPA: SCO family protein [Gammaproteobacteria bacterium]|nr:SCO family protein [Gammaproteobacteria bacterium]